MLEMPVMRTVTKRLVLRKTAPAYGKNRPSLQAVLIPISVDDLEIAFNFNRPIIIDRKFCL